MPGVVDVLTHEHRARTAWLSYSYKDMIGPPGKPFRPLYDDKIQYSGQPIALVVAETFEAARGRRGAGDGDLQERGAHHRSRGR